MPKQLMWIIGVAVGVMALGGVLFYAQPGDEDHSNMNQVANGASLNLNLDPANYDFGTISMKNGLVTKTFNVKNEQTEAVELFELYTSCMCTSAKLKIGLTEYGPFGMLGHGAMKMLNQALAPGQEAQLEVTFDPNAHGPSGIGVIERTVSLKSDSGEIASINIKATVTP
ncbi:MAG: DUF1573 domain-containing protein [Candidatus Doudnabacteria bacterium]|nr:DUF1573 domain-containing protein [Candidatus Doudnabacteria bacterium]